MFDSINSYNWWHPIWPLFPAYSNWFWNTHNTFQSNVSDACGAICHRLAEYRDVWTNEMEMVVQRSNLTKRSITGIQNYCVQCIHICHASGFSCIAFDEGRRITAVRIRKPKLHWRNWRNEWWTLCKGKLIGGDVIIIPLDDRTLGEGIILIAEWIYWNHGVVCECSRLEYRCHPLENRLAWISDRLRSKWYHLCWRFPKSLLIRIGLNEATLIRYVTVFHAEPLCDSPKRAQACKCKNYS